MFSTKNISSALIVLDLPRIYRNKKRIKPIWNELNGVTNKIVSILSTALLETKVLMKCQKILHSDEWFIAEYQVWPKVCFARGAFRAGIFAIGWIYTEFCHNLCPEKSLIIRIWKEFCNFVILSNLQSVSQSEELNLIDKNSSPR